MTPKYNDNDDISATLLQSVVIVSSKQTHTTRAIDAPQRTPNRDVPIRHRFKAKAKQWSGGALKINETL